jgi:hypothetical protein
MSAPQPEGTEPEPIDVAGSPANEVDQSTPPAPLALRIAIVVVVLLGSSVFLFGRLGHYALWDDEAVAAIPALGLWRTGDTTCVLGKNIVAYRNGSLLTNLSDHGSPPLMFALAAPSLGLLGQNAWAARLPFALCGLGTVGLLLHWGWRARADAATWILLGMAILGNVSLFLFSRQCRYYAPSTLLSVAVAYGYVFHKGRRAWLLAISLLSWALMFANPMNYVALYAAMAADYAFWGRRRQPLSWSGWLWLFVPQVLLAAPILLVWNPAQRTDFSHPHQNWIVERANLLYRNLRDLNLCEFGILPLIIVAPLLYFRHWRPWLVRASLAFLIYVLVMTIVSPQLVNVTSTADVRYLVPVIPLCMAIAVLVLRALSLGNCLAAAGLGLLAFGTNIMNLDPFVFGGFRSTVCDYIAELYQPPSDPYTVTAAWINEQVEPGKSICVLPMYMAYPLMFHAPGPVYAWQLDPATRTSFEQLDAIHFWGMQLPDYFIAFGPTGAVVPRLLPADAPVRYEPIATLDHFWKDMYRPELFWRTFKPLTRYDRERDAIYVFRRTDARSPRFTVPSLLDAWPPGGP